MGGSQDPSGKEAVPTLILSRKVAGGEGGLAERGRCLSPGQFPRGACGSAQRGTGDTQAVHSLVPAAGLAERGLGTIPAK